jgi:archaetidylinositol phosphate synthase
MGLVVGYLVLSINVYLETNVFGVFELGYGRIGPTETRLLLIGTNMLLTVVPPGIANAIFIAVLAAMVLMLGTRVSRNLATLAKLEPQRPRARGPSETPRATSHA